MIEQVGKKKSVLSNAPEVDVSVISFAYDNRQVLELLTKRGNLLANGKYDKLAEIEDKIKNYINSNMDIIKRPVMAFVTFTS